MKKLTLAVVAFVAFVLPVGAANADPGNGHGNGGVSAQRIDWD